MSGRLTILPKKTYCPWNPENVERVLRDERRERERLENEEKARRQSQRERADGATDEHINLFPEAKEAELKLAKGQAPTPASNAGILPVRLGGAPAATPFYMRPGNTDAKSKYDNDSGLRALGRGGAAAAAADEITGQIMRDQYEAREDSRKDKMDPMGRFVGSASSKSGRSRKETKQISNATPDAGHNEERRRSKEKRRRKKHRKRSRRSHDDGDASPGESECSSISSSGNRKKRASTHRSRISRKKRSNKRDTKEPEELEELRRRRQAREVREAERERCYLGKEWCKCKWDITTINSTRN